MMKLIRQYLEKKKTKNLRYKPTYDLSIERGKYFAYFADEESFDKFYEILRKHLPDSVYIARGVM